MYTGKYCDNILVLGVQIVATYVSTAYSLQQKLGYLGLSVKLSLRHAEIRFCLQNKSVFSPGSQTNTSKIATVTSIQSARQKTSKQKSYVVKLPNNKYKGKSYITET